MEKLKENLAAIWFILSSVAIAVLVFMFNRRGERIADLVYKSQMDAANAKLTEAKKALESKEGNYEASLKRYNDLKQRYSKYLPSGGGHDSLRDSGPDQSGNEGPPGTS